MARGHGYILHEGMARGHGYILHEGMVTFYMRAWLHFTRGHGYILHEGMVTFYTRAWLHFTHVGMVTFYMTVFLFILGMRFSKVACQSKVPLRIRSTVDPRLSEQQWPEDSKNHADK